MACVSTMSSVGGICKRTHFHTHHFLFPLLSKGGSFFNKRAFILYRFENRSRYLEKEWKLSYFIQEGASRFQRIKVYEIDY